MASPMADRLKAKPPEFFSYWGQTGTESELSQLLRWAAWVCGVRLYDGLGVAVGVSTRTLARAVLGEDLSLKTALALSMWFHKAFGAELGSDEILALFDHEASEERRWQAVANRLRRGGPSQPEAKKKKAKT